MFTLWQKQLNKYLSLARDALMQSKKRYLRDQKRKIIQIQTLFKQGDFVLIHNDHKRDKLDTEWLGPYRINEVKTLWRIKQHRAPQSRNNDDGNTSHSDPTIDRRLQRATATNLSH
jgi:hypothetical protein